LDRGFECYYNFKTDEIVAIPNFSQFSDEEDFKEVFSDSLDKVEKHKADFIWTEGTIVEIKLNVSKGTTQTQDIFLFEFKHNGKNIIKSRTTYKPKLLKVDKYLK
jgi:hypothetical protein